MPRRTYKTGTIWMASDGTQNDLYILSGFCNRHGMHVSLVNLSSGKNWTTPKVVADELRISENEMEAITAGHNFVQVSHGELKTVIGDINSVEYQEYQRQRRLSENFNRICNIYTSQSQNDVFRFNRRLENSYLGIITRYTSRQNYEEALRHLRRICTSSNRTIAINEGAVAEHIRRRIEDGTIIAAIVDSKRRVMAKTRIINRGNDISIDIDVSDANFREHFNDCQNLLQLQQETQQRQAAYEEQEQPIHDIPQLPRIITIPRRK